MNCTGIILAGGLGTRLRPITNDAHQKVVHPVQGKALIEYSIESLNHPKVSSLIFCVKHLAASTMTSIVRMKLPQITTFLKDRGEGICSILRNAIRITSTPTVICCNGDEIRHGFNLDDVLLYHNQHNKLATMVATYSNHLYRHRVLSTHYQDDVLVLEHSVLHPNNLRRKPDQTGLINVGFILLRRESVELFNGEHSPGWSGIIDPLCAAKEMAVFVTPSITYFNVGTEEELLSAQSFLSTG